MRIVTDSTVDFPSELIQRYNIEIVPLKVQVGEKSYKAELKHYSVRVGRAQELF